VVRTVGKIISDIDKYKSLDVSEDISKLVGDAVTDSTRYVISKLQGRGLKRARRVTRKKTQGRGDKNIKRHLLSVPG